MLNRLTILLFSLIVVVTPSQASSPPVNPLSGLPSLSWTMLPWIGNDKPYTNIRYTVFDAMQKSQDPLALVQQYKADAQKNPLNPQAVFRYAYATYQMTMLNADFSQTPELNRARRAAQRIAPTRTYEFARVLFLMEAESGGADRALLPLSERLLQHNPNDVQVLYRSQHILNGGMFPQEAEKAKTYAQRLVTLSPKSASVYGSLGSTYFKIWSRTKSRDDADKAIAGYQKFLSLAPLSDPFRSRAEFQIQWLRQGHMPTK